MIREKHNVPFEGLYTSNLYSQCFECIQKVVLSYCRIFSLTVEIDDGITEHLNFSINKSLSV